MRTLLRVAPALLLTVAACDSTAPAPVPTSIVLDRTELTIDDGDTTRLSVTVMDQRGQPMDTLPAATPLTWSTSAILVAQVDDGLVRAIGPGDAQVMVRAGEAEATAAVTVLPVAVGIRPATGIWHEGRVGTALDDSIGVRVFDRSGRPVPGVPVHFAVTRGGGTASAATIVSGTNGYARVLWVLGPIAGAQALEVTADGLRGRIEFLAVAAAGPPVEVRAYSGNGQAGNPGEPLPLPLRVRVGDAHGNAVGGHTVQWSVAGGGGEAAPASSVTDSAGIAATTWRLGLDGEQALAAKVGELAPALFNASTEGAADAPTISSILPEQLQPGATAEITGENFGSDPAAVRVTIEDVVAELVTVSPGALQVRVPDRHLLPCGPVADATVVVTVDGTSGATEHPLRVAEPRALAVGEAISLRTAAEMSCNALPADGEYIIAAVSAMASLGAMVPIHVSAVGTASASSLAPSRSIAPRGGATPAALKGIRNGRHVDFLESSRRLLESRPPRRRSTTGPQLSLAFAEVPDVGDTLSFRVPDIRMSDQCSSYFTVGARVVHVGTHSIALEDIAAPLAGTMDARIQEVAAEYDATTHALLVQNFGDPLAIDHLTDGNDRLYMLFSERVNQSGALGFVWSGDFVETDDCAASNQAEVFYATVPTVTDGGYGADTPEAWTWIVRDVIVHEVKHLSSLAERLAAYFAGGTLELEEVWLEESTARVAEEIWGRTAYGYQQRANTTHAESIYCEVRPSWPECAGMPRVMIAHFAALYEWHRAGGARTPLGRVTGEDNTFYGSGWSLARWAADHSGMSEDAFFRALTAGRVDGAGPALSGLSNLSARAGLDYQDMIEAWAVAMAVDDHPGLQPLDPLHTFPSWDTRDVFAGLNADFPDSWVHANPVLARELPLDGTTQSFYQLRGGSAAYWSLAGASSVLEVRGSTSVGLEPYVRITVIRTR